MRFAVACSALLLGACATAPPQPPAPLNYRALGTEPFWSLAINQREMLFEEPNGPTRIVQPTPRAISGVAGETYRTPRLDVNIVHARCSDGMSDRIYPDRVQVTADGRRYDGCGGEAVVPDSLAGTSWSVTAINGQPTPGGADYFIRFEEGRLGARFGCNSMGGDYRVIGDTLTTGQVASTQMACDEPRMTHEQRSAAVLSRPMRMSWSGGDALVLSNGAGRLELRRNY